MDPEIRKEVLSRIDRDPRSRTPLLLYSCGLFLIFSPLVPESLLEGGGGWGGLTRFLLGVLFFYVGASVHERLRLGRAFRELVESFEAFNEGFYGQGYKVKRAAVDLLIRTLSSDDEAVRAKVRRRLVRLCGEDLGEDRKAWEAWWKARRSGFRFPEDPGAGKGSGDREETPGYPGGAEDSLPPPREAGNEGPGPVEDRAIGPSGGRS